MPVPEVVALSQASKSGQIKAAVSACIAAEIRAGRDPDQAKVMCFSMVREKTGKEKV